MQLSKVILGLVSIGGLFLFVSGDIIKKNVVVLFCQSPGMFAMTFDQGPSLYTGTVLDALASRNVKASFHPVVSYLSDPSVVANLQRAAQEGHTIGLSAEASLDLSQMNNDDIFNAIDSRAQSIQSVTGLMPKFLRIPNYKNLSDDQINFIISKGYVLTTYNLDSYDYVTTDVLKSFKDVLDKLSPNTKGAFISVQRDYILNSVNQVPDILDYVMGKGYNLVTLDQCVKNAGGPGPDGGSGSGSGNNNPVPISSGNVANPPGVRVNSNSAANVFAVSPLALFGSLFLGLFLYAF